MFDPPCPPTIVEVLVDSLSQMGLTSDKPLPAFDKTTEAAFYQVLLKKLTDVESAPEEAKRHWERIRHRQREMSARQGTPVSFLVAAGHYVEEQGLVRLPVLQAYQHLKGLYQETITDPLTGVYNRRMFDETFTKEAALAQRHGVPLALLCCDLRLYKQVNDGYGHAMGDEVLRRLGELLVRTLRTSDVPCRLGGDEFAVVLPQTTQAQAELLAARLTSLVQHTLRPLVPRVPLDLDVGVGSMPEDGQQADQFLRLVDWRLYQAKQHRAQPPASAVENTDSARGPEGAAGREVVAAAETPTVRRRPRIFLEGLGATFVVHHPPHAGSYPLIDLSTCGVGLLVTPQPIPPTKLIGELDIPSLAEPLQSLGATLTLQQVYHRPLTETAQRVGYRIVHDRT